MSLPLGDVPARLRDALSAADFTVDAVTELLGPRAHEALSRNETTPARRRTADGSPLATLVRLFLLQVGVAVSDVEGALPGLVDDLRAQGLVVVDGEEVRARLDCRPYAADDRDLWVVSDLTPGLDGAPVRVSGDFVLGISPASTSLAQLTIREPVGPALDLGTGCGVQALHLAQHAREVVATDVNRRALDVARFNAALNDCPTLDVREGSLWQPVADERFDQIVTNPPFVISPATGERLVYRDSGLPGDAVVEQIVRAAPGHLTDGGWCQVLANWVIETDRAWDERVGAWIADGTSALVVQREVMDPAAYVELWLKDAGVHGDGDYVERYDTWLAWLDEQGVEGIGFGWINLHNAAGPVELLDWPYGVEQPIAPAVAAWGRAAGVDAADAHRLVLREDVVQETTGPPGAEDPATIVVRQQRGFRRARQVDTIEAALLGACDGDLSVGQILDALASLLGRDPADLRATYLPVVSELAAEGFLAHAP